MQKTKSLFSCGDFSFVLGNLPKWIGAFFTKFDKPFFQWFPKFELTAKACHCIEFFTMIQLKNK